MVAGTLGVAGVGAAAVVTTARTAGGRGGGERETGREVEAERGGGAEAVVAAGVRVVARAVEDPRGQSAGPGGDESAEDAVGTVAEAAAAPLDDEGVLAAVHTKGRTRSATWGRHRR